MPKGRHLKPEFFTDKHVVSMSPLARLLYQGLWCYAADCGHVDDEPIELKMRILPADNCNVEELLGELVKYGRIVRENGAIYLPKLSEHARVDKRYETACDWCKSRRDHGVTDPSGDTSPAVPTQGPQRGPVGVTRADPPNHDADGDGDGDGEVMVMGADKPPPRKRGHQIPDTWRPNQAHADFAAEKGIHLQRQVDKFRDHHKAKQSVFKDWDAAFRNWLRNAEEWGATTAPATKSPRLPHAHEIESPPDGLTDEEYYKWDQARLARLAARG